MEEIPVGIKQKVEILKALYRGAEILILDEPCTGLDVYNRSYLFSTIEELSKEKHLSIIYVTHYAEEITPLFQKALLLKNGHIFAAGDTSAVFNDQTIGELLGYPVEIRQEDAFYRLKVETQSKLSQLLNAR